MKDKKTKRGTQLHLIPENNLISKGLTILSGQNLVDKAA